MRFVVTFSHEKYTELVAALHSGDPGFEIPEGIYRQLAVVVEASNMEEAVDEACKQLGWPDGEVNLAPMGVISQADLTAQLRAQVDPPILAVKAVAKGF